MLPLRPLSELSVVVFWGDERIGFPVVSSVEVLDIGFVLDCLHVFVCIHAEGVIGAEILS